MGGMDGQYLLWKSPGVAGFQNGVKQVKRKPFSNLDLGETSNLLFEYRLAANFRVYPIIDYKRPL